MKRGLLLNLKPILEKFLEKEMGADSALTLINFSRKFSDFYTELENERIELVKKYGEQREDGGYEVLDEEKKEKFAKAFNKALSKEIDLELLDVNDFKSLRITPVEFSQFVHLFKRV